MQPDQPLAITGATGFLGRHIVARLAPRHPLRCISRGGSAPEGHEGHAIDLAAPDAEPALRATFQGCAQVVHAAGRVSHEARDAAALLELHLRGTERVLAAAAAAGVRRVLVIGTSGTIAVSREPRTLDERAPPVLQIIASWPYYRSKWLAEEEALRPRPGLQVRSLNPGLLLGPGDDPLGASTQAVRLFVDRGMAVVPTGGPCFVDVRDVARAVEAALAAPELPPRMLLGAANWTWRRFYEALARITGRRPPRLQLPARLAELLQAGLEAGDDADGGLLRLPFSPAELDLARHHWWADWSLAQRTIGFSPRDPLRTLEDTVEDLLASRRRGVQPWSA